MKKKTFASILLLIACINVAGCSNNELKYISEGTGTPNKQKLVEIKEKNLEEDIIENLKEYSIVKSIEQRKLEKEVKLEEVRINKEKYQDLDIKQLVSEFRDNQHLDKKAIITEKTLTLIDEFEKVEVIDISEEDFFLSVAPYIKKENP